ncbi:MAG TPA: glycosyltransferase [Candidatus Bilamarchaeaceae archaeon]|nr:glycosyltransferase [Candidatus Bilamarchaeaceae archaeon]
MRIAYFTDTYLPNTDGVVSSILNYRKELERRGHEVFIFSPGTKKQKKENTDEHVYYFTSAAFKPYPDYRIALFNFFSPLKMVRERGIDVIHSHGIATTGLAAIQSSKKLKIPSIVTFHTLVPEAIHYISPHENMHSFLQNVAWKYLRWYYKHYPKILAPSRYARRILAEHGIENTELLPTGIDLEVFNAGVKPAAARKKFGLTDEPVVLYVGRLAKEKNIEILIEAAPSLLNLLPKTKFLLVGKGPAETYYKDLVRKKDLESHFIFAGYIDAATLPSCYAAADVLAFPSKFDTQGLVVLEAMGTGLPAVVHKDSAAAEFVEDSKNGYLFSDNFDLYEKLKSTIKEKKKLRPYVLETAEKYDMRKSVDRLLEIYQTLKTDHSR